MNNVQLVEKPSLGDEIFAVLKARIIRWEYPPGHRLREEALCAEFGVSRVPVREALHTLVENDLLDRIPHRGCTVKQPDLAGIHDLYDVRLALELHVVERLAATGQARETLDALDQTWATLAQNDDPATLDGEFLACQDVIFHETLAEALGNAVLIDHLRIIDERLFFTRMADITTRDRLLNTCRQHRHILACIQRGDTAAARAAMQTNIDFGRTNVATALKDALARAYLATR